MISVSYTHLDVYKRQGIYTVTGIYTGDMKAALLAVFICSGYATLMQIIRTVKRSRLYAEHSCQVRIVCCGRPVSYTHLDVYKRQ